MHRFRQTLPSLAKYRTLLSGKEALEIGGPSTLFGDDGELPIYDVLKSVDNCLYSVETIWTGRVKEEFRYHANKEAGAQFLCDARDLHAINPGSYECVLASHCLEHVANPFRALYEWKRVLKTDGLLVLALPHKDVTFDWRRPTSTLEHVISDFNDDVGEDDLTHLEEILSLHDLTRDRGAGDKDSFQERCRRNHELRAMHHHVFDTMLALKMVDHARFHVVRVDGFGNSILVLASNSTNSPDNHKFLRLGARHFRFSPFPSDHLYS